MDETGQTDDQAKQQSNKGCLWLFVFVMVFAVGATVISELGGDDEEKATDTGAIDVCHQAVEDQLKAPGTADFGGEQVTHSGDHYTVTGYVDSENSFGASLRNGWTCEATWLSGDQWRPVVAVVG